MSHSKDEKLELKKGAFIISDAHYSTLRPHLLDLLKDISSKKLRPTQLILMGDIFDTLFIEVPRTIDINAQAIKYLNSISKDIELIYLEGNHDFNIAKIFPNAKVFKIQNQPVELSYKNKIVFLSHGDNTGDFSYKLYVKIIRNHFVMRFLNFINTLSSNAILNSLDDYLSKKEDCKEFRDFKEFTKSRLSLDYRCDYYIDGHFHQGNNFTLDDYTYINIGAFACNQRYFIVKSSNDVELREVIYEFR